MLRIEVRRQRSKTEHWIWISFFRLSGMVAPGKLPHRSKFREPLRSEVGYRTEC